MWKCRNCSEMNPDSSQCCQSCGARGGQTPRPTAHTSDAAVSSGAANENTQDIIVTTTPSVEGRVIEQYLDIVSGTDIYLVGGVLGGGLANQENLYGQALTRAKNKMISKAVDLGANAVVGVQISITSPGGLNNIIVVTNGTAVKLKI